MAEKTKNPGGIWKNDEKNYLNLSLDRDAIEAWLVENGDTRIKFVVFPNDYKEHGDSKPDFNVLFAQKREQASPPKQPKKASSLFG